MLDTEEASFLSPTPGPPKTRGAFAGPWPKPHRQWTRRYAEAVLPEVVHRLFTEISETAWDDIILTLIPIIILFGLNLFLLLVLQLYY